MVFYPFNDFLNNHEGDWEHINVIIDSQVPEQASILKVDYYFHNHVLTRSNPGIDFHIVDLTHPVIFVGGYSGVSDGWGSHGCYPIFGTWVSAAYDSRYPIEDGIYVSDIVNGNGDYLKYNTFQLNILPEPDQIDYNQYPEMSWIKARLFWGDWWVPSPGAEELQTINAINAFIETIFCGRINGINSPNDVGNVSPWGPKWNLGWDHQGDVNDVYTFYTHNPPPFEDWYEPE